MRQCMRIVDTSELSLPIKETGDRDRYQVCGMETCSAIHMVSDGHDFDDSIGVDVSHLMTLHPIDGLYCAECKGYTYDQNHKLSDPCPGFREWTEIRG